jgi:hypothetical protein
MKLVILGWKRLVLLCDIDVIFLNIINLKTLKVRFPYNTLITSLELTYNLSNVFMDFLVLYNIYNILIILKSFNGFRILWQAKK